MHEQITVRSVPHRHRHGASAAGKNPPSGQSSRPKPGLHHQESPSWPFHIGTCCPRPHRAIGARCSEMEAPARRTDAEHRERRAVHRQDTHVDHRPQIVEGAPALVDDDLAVVAEERAISCSARTVTRRQPCSPNTTTVALLTGQQIAQAAKMARGVPSLSCECSRPASRNLRLRSRREPSSNDAPVVSSRSTTMLI